MTDTDAQSWPAATRKSGLAPLHSIAVIVEYDYHELATVFFRTYLYEKYKHEAQASVFRRMCFDVARSHL
jgi:hypothetical protein